MASRRRVIEEVGDIGVGVLWWGGAHVWGAILGMVLALAPLLLAYLAVQLVPLSANLALALGTLGAFAVNLPPWDADDAVSLPLVVGGGAASVVIWDLTRGGAGVETLGLVLAIVFFGWAARRRIGKPA